MLNILFYLCCIYLAIFFINVLYMHYRMTVSLDGPMVGCKSF